MKFNLSTILSESARISPEASYLVTDAATHTYAEIDAWAARAAGVLASRGIGIGTRVALRLPNIPAFFPYYFALLRRGAVIVPMNPLLSDREVATIVHDATVSHLIVLGEDEVDTPAGIQRWNLEELMATETQVGPLVDIAQTDGDDTALIIFTSGTTGRPKGAELTHLQLFLTVLLEGDTYGITSDDVLLGALPLFHIYGLSGVLHSATSRAQTIYLMNGFSTQTVYDAIESHGVSVILGVPTMYHALIAADDGTRDLSSVRIAVSGGAPMPMEMVRDLERTFPNVTYLEGYGLTETCSAGTVNGGPFPYREGSIGRPLWGMQMRVVDLDGHELPPGPDHTGELVLRGHGIMKGYLDRPDQTSEALREGWLYSGDIAWIDRDGYAYLVGRLKELIIRGGYNVYPREIEEVLHAHPGVSAAAVVGRPDAHHGEEIVAFVVPTDANVDVHDVIEFVRQNLAHYKCPREVIMIDSLPQGSTGKIDKSVLRATVIAKDTVGDNA